jgi:hypothetical protein
MTSGALRLNGPVIQLVLVLLLRISPFATASTPRVTVIHIVAQDLRQAIYGS